MEQLNLDSLDLTKNSKKVGTQLKVLKIPFDAKIAADFHTAKRSIYHLYYMDMIDMQTRKTLLSSLKTSIIKHVSSFNKK